MKKNTNVEIVISVGVYFIPLFVLQCNMRRKKMRMAITVSLPEDLGKELLQFVQKRRLNKSTVVKMALQNYLFRDQFLEIRERFTSKARTKGIYTDEDVAKRLK